LNELTSKLFLDFLAVLGLDDILGSFARSKSGDARGLAKTFYDFVPLLLDPLWREFHMHGG
jgi:hypothetical protein